MLTAIAAGFVLGLSAGITPGPLSVLVLSQSLRHGVKEGVKVAIAPILTDLPIVAVCLVLAERATRIDGVLAAMSFVGGLYLAYLAFESMRARAPDLHTVPADPQSIRKGALVNVLNPHPYLFWLTVGASIVMRDYAEGGLALVFAFVIPFYSMLVGSKVVLAVVAGRSGRALPGKFYLFAVRGLGVLLLVFALVLLREAARLVVPS